MPIYLRNDVYYVDIRTKGGRRIRQSAGTKNKHEAQRLHDKLKYELWQHEHFDEKPKRLWEEAAVRWIKEKESEKKSIKDDISRLRMLPKLRGVYLHHMSRDFIMEVVDGLPCGNSTKNRYIALIRAILYKARDEWNWIDKAPKLKLKKEAAHRVRWLKPEEAERLINALPDNHWRSIAIFSFCTGLRQRNVFGLRWEQVDLDRKTAWIYPDETKSGRPIGVPLNDVAVRVLSERMGIHETYVFTNRENKPVSALSSKMWKRTLERAGISNFRWHDIRHTWASWLVQRGVPLLALKEMGGWERLDMVMRYAHLATDHLTAHATVLDNLEVFGHKIDTGSIKVGKEKSLNDCLGLGNVAPRPGLEPGTCGLTVRRSTD